VKPGDRVRVVAEGEWFNDVGMIVGPSPYMDWVVRLGADIPVTFDEHELEVAP
jgi:hypothetical protein